MISIEYIDHMGNDLSVVNSARVSFGKSKEQLGEGDIKLINYLAKNQHMTPFEHCTLSVKVKCPLFIRSQIHRHRTFCIDGESKIHFEMPKRIKKGRRGTYKVKIKKLYENFLKNPKLYKQMYIRVLDTKANEFTYSHISNVYKTGINPVFKITLDNKKTLICTENHKLLTQKGFQSLKDAIGLKLSKTNLATMSKECYVFTNGELAWRHYDWMKARKEEGLSVSEIAEQAGCSYHNVRKWLKIHNLQFNQIQTMLDYNQKYGVWNKGKTGYSTKHVVTEEHKQKIREARSGSKSNFWKGGVSPLRTNIARWTTEQAPKVHAKFNYTCQQCNVRGGSLHAHHIKEVVKYPQLAKCFDNLISLCYSCHAKVHSKQGNYNQRYKHKGNTLVPRLSKIVKIEYLGERETYDLGVEHQDHNYIANGIVVHNSYNEISRRYTSEGIEFFTPEKYRAQNKKSKQCSDGYVDSKTEAAAQAMTAEIHEHCLEVYNKMIGMNIAREMARGILPQNLITEFWMTGNLRNWIQFLGLRIDNHAQKEVQDIAHPILKLIKEKFPESSKALFKHQLDIDI